jgi:(2Fe-2S) ferredoxin
MFVCTNRRPKDAPLGPGCAEAGDRVYEALKQEVASRRHYTKVWVTQTQCLGICPREGATVAAYPNGHILTEVHREDAPALYARELAATSGSGDGEP